MTIVVQSGVLRVSGGGEGTAVFDVTLTGSNDGWTAGFTHVQRLVAANMGAGTGTQVRLTVKFTSWTASATASVYMGQYSGSGVVDFNTTPTHILFSGGDLTSAGGAQTFTSDWCNLPEAYDETKVYLVATDLAAATTVNLGSQAHTGDSDNYKVGDGDAATVDKDEGAYPPDLSDTVTFVTKVEVRTP